MLLNGWPVSPFEKSFDMPSCGEDWTLIGLTARAITAGSPPHRSPPVLPTKFTFQTDLLVKSSRAHQSFLLTNAVKGCCGIIAVRL